MFLLLPPPSVLGNQTAILEIVSPNFKYSTKFWQILFLTELTSGTKSSALSIHFTFWLVIGCGPMLSFKQSFIQNRRKLEAQHLNTQNLQNPTLNHTITESLHHTILPTTRHIVLLEASPKVILYCRFLYNDLKELLYDWDPVICSKAVHGLYANFYTWKG